MAQSVIGALRVNLALDSARFERGVGQAQASLRRMRQQFAAISAAAGAVGVAIGGVAQRVIQSANEIDRFSRVANAAPARFQKMAAAANTVGITSEKLADQLKDVNDRVGDFLSTGGGPMADFFENIAPKVGVTAEQFRNLSGPDALQLYVDSLQKANLSQGEMTFYLEAMASDLTMLLPLLQDGGAEMGRLGDRARQFGAILSADAIAQMKRTQVAVQEVGLVFRGFANQIATNIAPSIEALANGFSNLALEGKPLNVAFTAIADNIQRLSAYVATAVTFFGVRYVAALAAARLATLTLSGALATLRGALIRTGIGAVVVIAGELVYQFGRLVSAAGGFGNAMSLLGEVWRDVTDNMNQAAYALLGYLRYVAQDIAATFLSSFADIARGWADTVDGFVNSPLMKFVLGGNKLDISGAIGGAADGLDATAEDLRNRAAENLGATKFTIGTSIPSLEKLREVMASAEESTGGAADAAERLNAALQSAGGAGGGEDEAGGGAASKVNEKLTEIQQKAKQTADTIRGSFTDAFKGVLTGAQSMGDAVSGILSKLADMLLNSVGNALFGGISSAIGGALFPVPGFAAGTNYAPGGMALVGERGPELVNLPRGSQVVPNHKLGGGGGGNVDVRLFMERDGNWQAEVARISGDVSARTIEGYDSQLSRRFRTDGGMRDPRRIG